MKRLAELILYPILALTALVLVLYPALIAPGGLPFPPHRPWAHRNCDLLLRISLVAAFRHFQNEEPGPLAWAHCIG